MTLITRLVRQIAGLVAVALVCVGCAGYLPSIGSSPWQLVTVPTNANLSDISFTDDLSHGWLVGADSALLESTDGGKTWETRSLQLDDQSYRFTSVSFAGDEGWVAGEPGILLHTTNGGESWDRVPLSEKLPGSPNIVTALGPKSAEMTTNVGAIYRTTDGGRNWKAMVEEAVGVVRTMTRSSDGKYVAVSSRGNFYSTWEPGQNAWQPHNRNSSRRVQSMGFTAKGGLWMLARGGQVQFTDETDLDAWDEAFSPEFSTSWGLLDLAYRTPDEVWVAGGSGNLLRSLDGGKSWEKDRSVESVPSNLYRIVFLGPETGFILGQQGTILRYVG
ncbi:MAG: photosynthesis system II assembly factor Ycf48 [Leptolyngbyaceae cyanobacterium]